MRVVLDQTRVLNDTEVATMGKKMKGFFAAVVAIVLMTAPGYSQAQGIAGQGGGGRIGPPPEGLKPEDKVDEKAYKSAVDRMSAEPQQKRDPWAVVREKPQSK